MTLFLFTVWRMVLVLTVLTITSCTSVKTQITNQYKLAAFSQQSYAHHRTSLSILVTKPEATAGYETEQMLYINKPYELSSFAHNAWIDPPADMLFPLMVQSLQASGYFYAVASNLASEGTDYRLDTQLLELQQNFLCKPSVIELTAKIVLTQVLNNHVVASRIIKIKTPCSQNTPYGGVVAANAASRQLTQEVTRFVITHIAKS